MTEIAKANGIRVVLSSVLPPTTFPGAGNRAGAEDRRAQHVDEVLRGAGGRRLPRLPQKLADARGGLAPEMASDGVHPTEAGYRIMAPLAEAAIQEALRQP